MQASRDGAKQTAPDGLAAKAEAARKAQVEKQQQLFLGPLGAMASAAVTGGDVGKAGGSAFGTAIGSFIGGPFGGIIGTVAGGLLGKLFGKKSKATSTIQPIPVKVVNFSDMLSSLLNVTKSSQIIGNAGGINRLNNVRIQRSLAGV